MKLGAFSISLTVSDLGKSIAFYEKLGFSKFAGDINHNYVMMKNNDAVLGLFQGMFDRNILTFNPGWDQSGSSLDSFTDVRALHETLSKHGLKTEQVSLEGNKGPGSFVIIDPDGNPILIDQHI